MYIQAPRLRTGAQRLLSPLSPLQEASIGHLKDGLRTEVYIAHPIGALLFIANTTRMKNRRLSRIISHLKTPQLWRYQHKPGKQNICHKPRTTPQLKAVKAVKAFSVLSLTLS
jgi:hypothetical protein